VTKPAEVRERLAIQHAAIVETDDGAEGIHPGSAFLGSAPRVEPVPNSNSDAANAVRWNFLIVDEAFFMEHLF